MANAVCELASIVGDGQRSDEAELLLLRALALYEATNDRLGAARATAELAELAASSGRQALAAHLFEDALDRFRSIGDDQGSANVLDSLGQLAFLAGSVEEAESQLQQARRLHVRIGDPLGIANTTRNLGRAAIHAGRRSDAEDLLLEASTLYTALGVDLGNANVARDLGLLAFQAIEADAARAYLSRAADLFERVGNTRDEVWALSRVAVVELYFCTDPISALEPARRAIARLERLRGSLRSLVTRSETGERWEEVYEIAIRALLAAGAVDPAQRPTFEREALATACLYQGRLLHEELVTARRLPAGDPWAYLEPDEAAQAAAVEARLDAAQAAYDELLDRTRRLLAEHGVSPQDIDRAARTEIATHPETAALLDAMSERRRLLERALLRASTDREPVLPVIELAAVEATLRAQGATLVDLVWGFGLHVGFVLGPQGTLAVHDFDADPGAVAAIEDARTRLATLLATDPPDPDPDAFAELTTVLAERLWRPLVGPLGVSPIRLVIAPAFGAVPFAALQRAIGGGPLRILPGPALLVREKAA